MSARRPNRRLSAPAVLDCNDKSPEEAKMTNLCLSAIAMMRGPGDMNWDAGVMVPLGAFAMAIIIVAINSYRKMRERELMAHQDLRMKEMDHERRLKEMDIERLKLEVEKTRAPRV
jgi:hypothetical protein